MPVYIIRVRYYYTSYCVVVYLVILILFQEVGTQEAVPGTVPTSSSYQVVENFCCCCYFLLLIILPCNNKISSVKLKYLSVK